MFLRHFPAFRISLHSVTLLVLGLLSAGAIACGPAPSSSERHHLTVGLAFIPNIQFAPFYVADALGYYREAGLDVTLRHHSFSEDLFGAIAAGKEDAIFAGADEMMQARDHSVPLVAVATIYRKYPVALMVPADSSIRSLSDLRGHSIGVPGAFGETYFGFLAILQSAGLSQTDVNVQHIQFTQVAALTGRKVDAVVGYLNNEAIQFKEANFPVRVFAASEVVRSLPLVSNALGVPENKLSARGADVRALVTATMRGVRYTIDHPQEARDTSKKVVPGLDDPKKAADAMAVLQATIPMWQSDAQKPGYNDPATWAAMARFMLAYGLVSKSVDANKAFSNDYLS